MFVSWERFLEVWNDTTRFQDVAAVARELGIAYQSARNRAHRGRAAGKHVVARTGVSEGASERQARIEAAQQGVAPDYDIIHAVPDGLTLKGTSTRYDGAGNVDQVWNKTKVQGRADEEVTHILDPKRITKVSTLYDNQGRVTQQWVSEKPEDVARELAWKEAAAAFAEKLPRAVPVKAPDRCLKDLLACYPVGDHHLGMLSWDKETGADWDIAIAEKMLAGAAEFLVNAMPPCEQGLVVFLGDFLHYDSIKPVTPTHGHVLDADSRYPKMVRAAIRSMRRMIELALTRHQRVHVIVEIGNHDLYSSIFLIECLRNVYEAESRITIDTSPAHFHFYEFGACLVGTHHGHGHVAKANQLPLIMANDRPEAWGRTQHRYWWTGHVHHQDSKDFVGCVVESFRILAPADAHAHQNGYRAIRDMKAILLHRSHGEVSRFTVSPAMLEAAA